MYIRGYIYICSNNYCVWIMYVVGTRSFVVVLQFLFIYYLFYVHNIRTTNYLRFNVNFFKNIVNVIPKIWVKLGNVVWGPSLNYSICNMKNSKLYIMKCAILSLASI